MLTDRELLTSYTRDRAEEAFTELVARHINLVYSAALREAHGNTGQAEDLTQAVFQELARKADRLENHPALAGWLYTCVRHLAANVRRAENRRQRREQEAQAMKELLAPETTEAAWQQLQPVLDNALHELNETDRAAVVLRFFEDRSHKEVGTALGLAENAARMRVERALEKLKTLLEKRGITSTAAGLAAALTLGGAASAPSGFAATVATGALAVGVPATGATWTLLKFMGMTKIKAGIIGAVVVGSVATTLIIEKQAQAGTRDADATLRQQAGQLAALQAENERLKNPVVPSADGLADLQRLRDEADNLRQQTNELVKLREEDGKLKAALETARYGSKPTPGSSLPDPESVKRMNFAKTVGLALLTYANEHGGRFPMKMEDAGTPETLAKYDNTSPVDKDLFDQFELVYHGTEDTLAKYSSNSQILLVRERQPRTRADGSLIKVYAFTDGSGQSHHESDPGHYAAWENERMVPAGDQQ